MNPHPDDVQAMRLFLRFSVLCAVVFGLRGFVKPSNNNPDAAPPATPAEVAALTEKIRAVTAQRFSVSPSTLTPEIRFVEDLRIPIGEVIELARDLEAIVALPIDERRLNRVRTFSDLIGVFTA